MLKGQSRVAAILWWGLLLTTDGAHAQATADYLVLDVVGRVTADGREVSIGNYVAAASRLRLEAGQHVTLLGNGLVLPLEGPTNVTPNAAISASPPSSTERLSWVAALGDYLRNVLRMSEYRGRAQESAADFRVLHLTSGPKCIIGKRRPRIVVPAAARNHNAVFSEPSTGTAAMIPFDSAIVDWPPMLPFSSEKQYEVSVGGRKLLWTLYFQQDESVGDTELISWMIRNNCSDQVVAYVRSLPPAITWGGGR